MASDIIFQLKRCSSRWKSKKKIYKIVTCNSGFLLFVPLHSGSGSGAVAFRWQKVVSVANKLRSHVNVAALKTTQTAVFSRTNSFGSIDRKFCDFNRFSFHAPVDSRELIYFSSQIDAISVKYSCLANPPQHQADPVFVFFGCDF